MSLDLKEGETTDGRAPIYCRFTSTAAGSGNFSPCHAPRVAMHDFGLAILFETNMHDRNDASQSCCRNNEPICQLT